VRAVIEEHGRGRQLMRARLRPHVGAFVRVSTGVLAALAGVAALARSWETAAVGGALLLALVAYAAAECGRAMAAAVAALDVADAVEPAPAPAPARPHEPAGRAGLAEAPADSGAELDRAGAPA
jgi:hypothetical protein